MYRLPCPQGAEQEGKVAQALDVRTISVRLVPGQLNVHLTSHIHTANPSRRAVTSACKFTICSTQHKRERTRSNQEHQLSLSQTCHTGSRCCCDCVHLQTSLNLQERGWESSASRSWHHSSSFLHSKIVRQQNIYISSRRQARLGTSERCPLHRMRTCAPQTTALASARHVHAACAF